MAIANRLAGHRIRFGVGLSGGYQSSEDQFIFTTWEEEPELVKFEAPEIQRWIRCVLQFATPLLEGVEILDEKEHHKSLAKLKLNKATKADCIEARLKSNGTNYTLLCNFHQSPPSGAKVLPEFYWEKWDTSSYHTQCAWVLARSMQHYLYTGRAVDAEIRNFLVLQSAPKAGKTVFMDALLRLVRRMGMTTSNLPNSNVFSKLEFFSGGCALIDDEDKSAGSGRQVNPLFTSAIVKTAVSGGTEVCSMKNSSASVPITNKIMVINNTNHVNLYDIVNADAGNRDRLRLLHVGRAFFDNLFVLYGLRVDPKNIAESYDRLVATMLWSPLLPLEPERWCLFDPERYDLGQLLVLVMGIDPAMSLSTAIYEIMGRYPDHYRVNNGAENCSLYGELHPLRGSQKLDPSKVIQQIAPLLSTDPDYFGGCLAQPPSTWYALYQAVSKQFLTKKDPA
jgi:hypothetical protein